MLASIEDAADDTTCHLSFEDEYGNRVRVTATVHEHADVGTLVGYDPDPFAGWAGDAESVRSVAASVVAFMRSRRLSPLRTEQ